jgi:hypothetical protein
MRRPARRFGILVLALALVPGQFSTADAGVIPWLYDAVFGPVGHYGYGGYGYGYQNPYAGPQVSYAMPAAPAYQVRSNCGPTGCGPAGCATPSYTVGYRPMFVRPTYCSTGACSTVLNGYVSTASNCGTCSSVASTTVASSSSACAAQTAWKSKEAKTEWPTEVITGEAAVPAPAAKDDAPKPTFKDEPADPSKTQPTVAVEKVVVGSGDVAGNGTKAAADQNWTESGKPATAASSPAAGGEAAAGQPVADGEAVTAEGVAGDVAESAPGSAGFGETQRGPEEDVNKIFSEPLPGVESAIGEEAVPTTTPLLPEAAEGLPKTGETPAIEAAQPLNLEDQSSLKFHAPVKRIAFRAGFGRATVARTSVVVNDDYVVPTAVTLRLVSR